MYRVRTTVQDSSDMARKIVKEDRERMETTLAQVLE
jgi:hypothetical protein